MNRETSLYLDILRFVAAMTVFLGHVSGAQFTGGLLWQIGPFTAEAVTVFFVLSGFVIGYATHRRETRPLPYAIARAARLYSVALPALAATFVLDTIGRNARPELYSLTWGYSDSGQLWQFLSGLLFVNQFWFVNLPQGSDLAYWSLGYEVWYYVIFGVAIFVPSRRRVPATILVLLLVGPAIAAMFPLWLFGLGAYGFCARYPLKRSTGAWLYTATLAAWAGYELWAFRHGRPFSLVPAILHRPELAQDYIVGALFAVHLVAFHAMSPACGGVLSRFARPIRWLAGTTFTVYLFHLPIAQFLTTQVPWPPSAWQTRLIIIGGTLAIMFLVAEVTERRKEMWRGAFETLLPSAKSRQQA